MQHPDVALIAFTGSLKVGLMINEQASKTPGGQNFVKKVIAEMGGKNAVIVDSDADLDEAVKGVVDSAFGYTGQKCSAGSRAIVLDGIYDQFLNRLVEATRSLKVGPAEDPGSSLGPVVDEEARNRILRFIEKGKTEARLAYRHAASAEREFLAQNGSVSEIATMRAMARTEDSTRRSLIELKAVDSAYGAAGSLILILLWVYYSSQVFLFGAQLTHVFAMRDGAPPEPKQNAVLLTEEERRKRGLS